MQFLHRRLQLTDRVGRHFLRRQFILHSLASGSFTERMENHKGQGMNVLFNGDHVEWFDAQNAQFILDELKAGHNPPRWPAN
jgi:hypothetical protein